MSGSLFSFVNHVVLLGLRPFYRARHFQENVELLPSLIEMAMSTNISMERLKEIEAGNTASKEEWYKIAYALSTSTHVVKKNYYFNPIIGELDLLLHYDEEDTDIHHDGFWGHIGILLKNQKKALFLEKYLV